MRARWRSAVVLTAVAVFGVLAHAIWELFLLDTASDPVAWSVSLLPSVVVPVLLASAGVVLLPARRLRLPLVGAVALAGLAIAAGVASGMFADDIAADSLQSRSALSGALVLIAAAALILAAVIVRIWLTVPLAPRVVLAIVLGPVGAVVIAGIIGSVLVVWLLAPALLITLLVAPRRTAFRGAR